MSNLNPLASYQNTNSNAPYGYKKDGTPRIRRACGTGPRFRKNLQNLNPLTAPIHPPPPTYECPTGCGLKFAGTKNPQNSLLVHVRYKSQKGCELHQNEFDKMVAARKTDFEVLRAKKNARQRKYRNNNLEMVEYKKKLSRGREKAREILGAEGGRGMKDEVEKLANELVKK